MRENILKRNGIYKWINYTELQANLVQNAQNQDLTLMQL